MSAICLSGNRFQNRQRQNNHPDRIATPAHPGTASKRVSWDAFHANPSRVSNQLLPRGRFLHQRAGAHGRPGKILQTRRTAAALSAAHQHTHHPAVVNDSTTQKGGVALPSPVFGKITELLGCAAAFLQVWTGSSARIHSQSDLSLLAIADDPTASLFRPSVAIQHIALASRVKADRRKHTFSTHGLTHPLKTINIQRVIRSLAAFHFLKQSAAGC